MSQNSAKEEINIKNKTILFLLLVIAVFAVISCTKAECKISADCQPKPCSASRCDSGKCVYDSIPNCCGNGNKDSLENGKPGNKCTCPQDYGNCEGKGKVKQGSQMVDAAYAHYYCSSNECVMGVESKDASSQNFLDSIIAEHFKASAVMKYNKPFDMSRDTFELKITLDDASQNLIMPVKFNNVKILSGTDYSKGELLVADKTLENEIYSVGDTTGMSIPLNLNYKPQQIEEAGSLRFILDYSYTKNTIIGRNPDNSPIYNQELARGRFSSPAKQIFFVRSE